MTYDILKKLNLIAEKLGVKGDDLWDALVAREVHNGWVLIGIATLLTVASCGILWGALMHWDKELVGEVYYIDIPPAVFFTTSALLATAGIICFGIGISMVLSPEGEAFLELLQSLR